MSHRVAQCMIQYLPPTMGYIYDHLVALGRARSVVLAARAFEAHRFPFEPVYALPEPTGLAALIPRDSLAPGPLDSFWEPIIQREGVCLIHVHDGRIASAFLPVARRLGIPFVVTFLGRDASANLDNPQYLSALRLVFEEGDLVVVMSCEMAHRIHHLGCPKHKLRVVHHGVPLEQFPFAPRRAPLEGPTVILSAGRLIPKKGCLDLVAAFVMLSRRNPDVVLRVVGEGPLMQEMQRILRAASLQDRVEFTGRVERHQVASEMAKAHLFCLPSCAGSDGDSEGIPNTLKEAMASGLPVVSTLHAGIPELVRDGISGYLVPEGSPEAIADRLTRLLDQPDSWEGMGSAGRGAVETGFSLDEAVQQLEAQVYEPLLASTGSWSHDAVQALRSAAIKRGPPVRAPQAVSGTPPSAAVGARRAHQSIVKEGVRNGDTESR